MGKINQSKDSIDEVVTSIASLMGNRLIKATLQQNLVSGLYERREWRSSGGSGISTGLTKQVVETVRLDVDGWYPQSIVSGTYTDLLYSSVDWIANYLSEISPGVWEGNIVRRFGDQALMPYQKVRVQVPRTYGLRVFGAKMTLTFLEGAPSVTRILEYASPYFRTAEFEYDRVEGASQVMSFNTGSHPERPSSLPKETLTITEVYSRLGVEVVQSPNTSTIPLSLSGADDLWSNQELNDAMHIYWSRYKPRAQWAAWQLYAGRHVNSDYGGIMFDFANGPIQRQGCAVFGEKLADMLPPGEAHPAEWIRRNRFFAAVHELGHCFNLAHSWQKGPPDGTPDWTGNIGSTHEGDPADSFMNYPHYVPGFFSSFDYRFEDYEIVFVRHAPEEFVEMGANDAGKDHAYRMSRQSPYTPFSFTVAVNRSRAVFEFMEPVSLTLTLTNTSDQPQRVDNSLLQELHNLSLVIQPINGPARQWRPYASPCTFGNITLLTPGQSITETVFISAGADEWYVSEPGSYTLYAVLNGAGLPLVAPLVTLRVAHPQSLEAEYLAQDYFSDEVGRALAFGGTRVMTKAMSSLREIADQLKESAVGRYALLTLALPLMQNRKVLRLPQGASQMTSIAAAGGVIDIIKAAPDEARQLLHSALMSKNGVASETFGSLLYGGHMETYANWLTQLGDKKEADKVREVLHPVGRKQYDKK